MGHAIIHPQLQSFLDDFCFAQFDQWSVDFHLVLPFHSGFGGKVSKYLKRGDELGSAIGITAVVDSVDSDKNIAGFFYLGVSQTE